MRSVMQAAWLLTISFGNIIDMIIANWKLLPAAEEYFMLAGLMILDILLFIYLASCYEYVPEFRGELNDSNKTNVTKFELSCSENQVFQDDQ